MQGFFAAVDRETLRFWRVTAADLAELASGMTESRPKWAPKPAQAAQALAAEAEIQPEVKAVVATSDAPVVNTLWKVWHGTFRRPGGATWGSNCVYHNRSDSTCGWHLATCEMMIWPAQGSMPFVMRQCMLHAQLKG